MWGHMQTAHYDCSVLEPSQDIGQSMKHSLSRYRIAIGMSATWRSKAEETRSSGGMSLLKGKCGCKSRYHYLGCF